MSNKGPPLCLLESAQVAYRSVVASCLASIAFPSLRPVLIIREPWPKVLAAVLGFALGAAVASAPAASALLALVHPFAGPLKILIQLCSQSTWVLPKTMSSP